MRPQRTQPGLLLGLALAASTLVLLGHPHPVLANPGRPTALALAPAVAPAPAAVAGRGPFLERSLVAALPAGPLLLAATPDGTGPLCVDDEARLSIADAGGLVATWEHAFYTADRRAIACLAAPVVATLPQAGVYTVTLTLTDRFAPTYSATPLFLVAGGPSVPTTNAEPAVPEPTAVLAATMLPAPTPPALVGSAVLVATRPPAPSPVAAATTTATPVTPVPAPPPPAPPAQSPQAPGLLATLWPWALVGGLLLLALALVPRRPRPRPAASSRAGTVQLLDRATGEARTLVLAGEREYALRRRPLSLAPGGAGPSLARVRLSPQGLLLLLPDGAEQTLGHDAEASLAGGEVTLRFRAIGAAARPARPATRGASR